MKNDHSKNLIQKVSLALKEADGFALIKFNDRDRTWEIWLGEKPYIVNIKSLVLAQATIDELNYEYMARRAIKTTISYVKEMV